MRRLALIPARGGSKRLPRKNIVDFLGQPIISWTIKAAIETGLFEKVVVSTEDAEIAAIAKEWGADIDDRDPALATDEASVSGVCLDVLEKEKTRGNIYDLLCVLYPTAPLRTSEDIAATVALIEPGACNFALAATFYDLPPHQALTLKNDNVVEAMWPEIVAKRASDVGTLVCDNGSTYAVSVPAFIENKGFYGSPMKVHLMPRNRSQDIDEEIDLELARFFAGRQKDLS